MKDCTKIHAEHKVGLDLSLLPEGWVDTSYQHDMCASYSKGDLMIYVSTEFSDKQECSIWNDATQEEFGNSLTWEEATSLVKAQTDEEATTYITNKNGFVFSIRVNNPLLAPLVAFEGVDAHATLEQAWQKNIDFCYDYPMTIEEVIGSEWFIKDDGSTVCDRGFHSMETHTAEELANYTL